MYNVKIDNKEIKVRDGFTINEEFNEKLDSGILQFITDGGVANIDPFDSVVFDAESSFHTSRKKLLVDTYQANIESFGDTLETSDYLYQVTLFSESKILERITCPYLSITKRADGVVVSVWQKIKEYCQQYLPRVFVYDESSIYYKKIECSLKYDRALETKFSMECPEMSWKNPTLKEVLNDLFSVANCIPVVKDNVLTYFDLTTRGNEIDTSKLTNLEFGSTSADYCDNLTIPLENALGRTTIRVEYVTPRTDDSSELLADNMKLITQKPIYAIKNLYVYLPSLLSGVNAGFYEINLMRRGNSSIGYHDFIVEKDEWAVLNPRLKKIPKTDKAWDYQAFVLYYERGSNVISSINNNVEWRVQGGVNRNIYRLENAFIFAHMLTKGTSNGDVQDWVKDYGTTYDLRNAIFKIEYETIDDATLDVGKAQQIKHPDNKLFDGQSNQTIDINKQTLYEYAKVNRLASKITTIYGEYFDERQIPQLADTMGNKVLFSRSVTYYDGQMFFKGMLVDNYVLRDYYTGVLSQRRSWVISADSNTRHDVVKFYMMASTNHQLAKFDDTRLASVLTGDYNHLVDNFKTSSSTTSSMRYILNKFYNVKDGYSAIPSTDYILNDSIYDVVGKSFRMTISFIDNAVAGYRVIQDVDDDSNNFRANSIVKYVDENGENNQNIIYLTHKVKLNESEEDDYVALIDWLLIRENWQDTDTRPAIYDEVVRYADKKPLLASSGFEELDNQNKMRIFRKYFKKDNRETIKTTIQFEYASDDDRIIITDHMINACPFSPSSSYFGNGKIYFLQNGKFKPTEKVARGVLKSAWFLDIEDVGESSNANAYQTIRLINQSFPLTENDAWCYTDISGNILFACNGGIKNIVFEIRHFRDNNVYNSVVDKVIIGKSHETDELEDAYEENPPTITSIKVLNRTIAISDVKDFMDADD